MMANHNCEVDPIRQSPRRLKGCCECVFQICLWSGFGTLLVPQAAAGPDAGDPSATATRIEAGKEFSFQIEVLHKRNYFKVKSPGDGVLRLELTKELEQHRSLFPWWGEIESEDGKRREFRSGIWDRRVAKGEEVILAVRSNLHSFNEVAHDEVIRAKVVFMPEEFEGPPNPADSVRRWSFSIERTSPSQ